jgi:hypothetical protein
MVRNVFAILVVPWVWFAFAVPGNQLVFLVYPEALDGQTPLDYLLVSLVTSALYTFMAAAVCCWIAKPDFRRVGLLVPLALLAFGVFTQIVYWDVLPLWYHLVAIALILPVATAGTGFVSRRRRTRSIAQVT